MNPRPSSVLRNPCSAAAATSQPARTAGCRRATGALSSTTGRPAPTVGRHSSIGGVSAGSVSGSIVGSTSSAPPGACGLAATVPVTWTTVSSPSSSSWAWVSGVLTTIWLRPDRSRRTRKLTAASRRLRWIQPATVTVWPTAEGISWLRMRIAVFTSVGHLEPRRCGRRGTRGATTPSPDLLDAGPASCACIRSGVSSRPARASPSQLPATLSCTGNGATRFRHHEQDPA